MARYLLQRLGHTVIVLLVVTATVFVMMNMVGNPVRLMLPEDADPADVQQLTRELGLDQPVPVRYVKFMAGVVRGDFGKSFKYNAPAAEVVMDRVPVTAQLSFAALTLATVMAIPLGVISAVRRNSWLDLFATALAVVGRSMPGFWLGIMLMLLFSKTAWLQGTLPISGSGTWKHMVLPTVTTALGLMAILAQLTRSSLLDVLRQDYMTTARAKGLTERVVIIKHGLRNSLIPVVTMLGLQMGLLLEGAVITETVFAVPGMGRLSVSALRVADFPVVQAAVVLGAVLIVLSNLLVDLVYGLVDPRIRYE